ncbi:MAG: hypothetical protein EOP45_20490 [Sphingobacteriaceae bacterium]|nr:MAG: hypothetical protein EOP45_20490 [Sphingobacteriaceae bacterium]
MLIYGPEGSGKLCWIQNYLASQYNESVHNLKAKYWEFQISNKIITLFVLYSPYHFIINPSVHGSNDKMVLVHFLKEIGSTPAVSKYFERETCRAIPKHKIIVISHADALSYSAQRSLTNIMDKSIDNCRLVLSCRSLSKIIDPVISRCMKSTVCPNETTLYEMAIKVCKDENVEMNDEILQKLVSNSSGNVRNLLNSLQLTATSYKFHSDKMHMPCADDILVSMVFDDKPLIDHLPKIRSLIYDSIFIHQTPGELIYILTKKFVKRLLGESRSREAFHKLLEVACHYDEACCKGSKLILHYEAFILHVAQLFEQI